MTVGCVICSEKFSSADPAERHSTAIRECGHIFHLECLKQWLAKSLSCPVCRTFCADKQQFFLRVHLQSVNNLDVSGFYQTPAQRRDFEAMNAAKDAELAEYRKKFAEFQKYLDEVHKKSRESARQAIEVLQNMTDSLEKCAKIDETVADLSQTLPGDRTAAVVSKISRRPVGRPLGISRTATSSRLQQGTSTGGASTRATASSITAARTNARIASATSTSGTAAAARTRRQCEILLKNIAHLILFK